MRTSVAPDHPSTVDDQPTSAASAKPGGVDHLDQLLAAAVYQLRSDLYPLRSMRRLEHLLGWERADIQRIAEQAPDQYQTFFQEKTNGKKRRIDHPRSGLKALQVRLVRRVLSTVTLPAQMLGTTRGSIVENCAPHVGQAVVIKLDIKGCFGAIRMERVFDMFKVVFGCSDRIARLLTRLTTFRGCLPQGAPTSPCMAHLVLLPMNHDLADLAGRAGCAYTLWVDDITISGPRADHQLSAAESIIRRHGFRTSPGKSIALKNWLDTQAVTGCVLNRRLSVGRRRMEDIRKEIIVQAHQGNGVTERLTGLLHYVHQVNPRQAARLRRFTRFKLSGKGGG